jgi:hypothetical protein
MGWDGDGMGWGWNGVGLEESTYNCRVKNFGRESLSLLVTISEISKMIVLFFFSVLRMLT